MRQYAGTGDVVKKTDIIEQMRSEVISVLEGVVNSLGDEQHPVGALQIPNKKKEMFDLMNERVFDERIRERGLRIVAFNIESVTLTKESEDYLKQYQTGGSSSLSRGSILETMHTAAGNEGGAGAGFMGIGMAGMGFGAAGNMMGNIMPQQPQQQPDRPNIPQGGAAGAYVQTQQGVPCPKCGTPITGKFCPNCGEPAPYQGDCT